MQQRGGLSSPNCWNIMDDNLESQQSIIATSEVISKLKECVYCMYTVRSRGCKYIAGTGTETGTRTIDILRGQGLAKCRTHLKLC